MYASSLKKRRKKMMRDRKKGIIGQGGEQSFKTPQYVYFVLTKTGT
jgi:hypothetical protein